MINGIRYEIGSRAYHKTLLREERRQKSTQAWKQAHDSLLSDVKFIHNAPEREELHSMLSRLDGESTSGFAEEIDEIRRGDTDSGRATISEQMQRISKLIGRADRLALDEHEADKLKPVKTTYFSLKEASVLTAMFKQYIREFPCIITHAKGTQKLCVRVEELLTAPAVTREEYNEVFKEAKTIFAAQMSEIESALLAEKIGETLQGMGYTLFDEEGNPADMTAGKMYILDTPYDGYRARMKVGQNNTVVTRVVRVVGSEAEKSSVSEYQRQKDIETGKKMVQES